LFRDMSDLTPTIETLAGKPLEVETEEGRSKQRSLKELIEADKYLKSGNAAAATNLQGMGIRFGKFRPPGGVGSVTD
jgi:hypothetical protein